MSHTGLVVGKFCPLHRGHQLLIDFARGQCDRLILISYTNPEFPGYPRAVREQWLAALYPDAVRLVVDDAVLAAFAAHTASVPRTVPHNDAPDADHRAFVAWMCLAILGTTVDIVFTSEDYGDGFAEALTDSFRAEAGYAGKVRHQTFDRDRRAAPISGTMIRSDPVAHRGELADIVADSLVKRIGLIGGESSGKSTLASALAKRFGTCWVHEYGRELWVQRDGLLDFEELLLIGQVQIAREEEALPQAHRFLFCDTTPLVTLFYSQSLFGRVDPALERLAERRYDHHLLCAPDFAFVQDGHRVDETYRREQHDYYVDALRRQGQPFTLIEGPLDQRVEMVAALLEALGQASRSGTTAESSITLLTGESCSQGKTNQSLFTDRSILRKQ